MSTSAYFLTSVDFMIVRISPGAKLGQFWIDRISPDANFGPFRGCPKFSNSVLQSYITPVWNKHTVLNINEMYIHQFNEITLWQQLGVTQLPVNNNIQFHHSTGTSIINLPKSSKIKGFTRPISTDRQQRNPEKIRCHWNASSCTCITYENYRNQDNQSDIWFSELPRESVKKSKY